MDSSKRKEIQENNCCPGLDNEESVLKPATRSRKVLSWIVLKSFDRNYINSGGTPKRGFEKKIASVVVRRVTM